MKSPIRFKDILFYPERGELSKTEFSTNEENVTRLAPQPSKLLLLLLENYPDIVNHDKIHETLWPDVQVDFEKSLHFCIRQIRAALNDDAANPRFIETIPRRGYRWIAELANDDEMQEAGEKMISATFTTSNNHPGQSHSQVAPPPLKMILRKIFLGLGMIGIALLVFYILTPLQNASSNSIEEKSGKLRVAIMPFIPSEKTSKFTGNDIALRLLGILSNQKEDAIEIVGPTTTSDYQQQMRLLVSEFRIDVIINGKFSEVRDTSRLLVEVIRAEDGAHLWVKYFHTSTKPDSIVERVVDGFLQHFEISD